MLPHDDDIQVELLKLLARAPEGRMYCQDVYSTLAYHFPYLTDDERGIPYGNSLSYWANRVQFARQRLVQKGWLNCMLQSGRGYWEISDAGRHALTEMEVRAKRLLAELMELPASRPIENQIVPLCSI